MVSPSSMSINISLCLPSSLPNTLQFQVTPTQTTGLTCQDVPATFSYTPRIPSNTHRTSYDTSPKAFIYSQ